MTLEQDRLLRECFAQRAKTLNRAMSIFKASVSGESVSDISKRAGVTRQRIEQILNPHKANCRMIVQRAVESGALVRPETCSKCGDATKVEGHHPDYSKPLMVEWLCRKCHAFVHRKPQCDMWPSTRNTRKVMNFRLNTGLIARLKKEAWQTRKTMTQVLVDALTDKLSRKRG